MSVALCKVLEVDWFLLCKSRVFLRWIMVFKVGHFVPLASNFVEIEWSVRFCR